MNRPIALVCYICGRQFGTKSLGIHIKTCQKKWEQQESLKPPKQRRPCPRSPPGLEQLLSKDKISKKDIEAFNNGSFNTFKEEALVECQYCGRKFNPKSLIPHQKACKTNPMIKKPYVGRNQQKKIEEPSPLMKVPQKQYSIPSDAYDQGPTNLTPCYKCKRKFAPDRIDKHQKICKGPQKKTVPTISEKYEVKQATKPKFNNKKMTAQKPKWKAQSEELQQAMRQMRKIKAIQEKGGDLSSLPPPPRSNYDHYIQCHHCGRKYAPDVAQRHIPKCANIINKPGGIKPSKIQSKYVGNTGTSSKFQSSGLSSGISSIKPQSKIQPPSQPVKNASKPMMTRKR